MSHTLEPYGFKLNPILYLLLFLDLTPALFDSLNQQGIELCSAVIILVNLSVYIWSVEYTCVFPYF